MNKKLRKFFKRQFRNYSRETDRPYDLDHAYSIIMRHAHAPRLDIETDVTPEVFDQLIQKVESTWSRLGQEDAHWSVITHENFRKDLINNHIDDFFIMGEGDIARVEAALNRVNSSLSEMKSAMDFGCGVGRLSIPLGKRCQHVLGVDISSTHLREAKENIERERLKNVDLSLIGSVDAIGELPEFDLVFSILVLQHNSPPVILAILKELCSRVKSGGYLYIQTQTYRSNYRYDAESDLEDTSMKMAMHVLPQNIFLQTIQDAGLILLEVTEDGSAWDLEFRSQVVLAKKR